MTGASRAAKVSRQTCSVWVHHDVHFRAALNGLRVDVATEIADRLRRLAGASLDLLELRVGQGDQRAAAALKALAEIAPMATIGLTTPDAVAGADWANLLSTVLEEIALDPTPDRVPPPQVDLTRDDDELHF